jgi:hypothetical protein
LSANGLQDDLEEFAGDEEGEEPEASGSGTSTDDAPQDPKDKRINDLMSKWQAAEAKAKRLEAAQKGGDAGDDNPPAPEAAPAPVDEGLNEILRDAAREALFKSDPRLERFGFKADVITGSTAAEMRESLARQRALLDAVEGKVRNEVLAEHGLTNDAAGGGSEKPTDFASMKREDFLELVERVKAGG